MSSFISSPFLALLLLPLHLSQMLVEIGPGVELQPADGKDDDGRRFTVTASRTT